MSEIKSKLEHPAVPTIKPAVEVANFYASEDIDILRLALLKTQNLILNKETNLVVSTDQGNPPNPNYKTYILTSIQGENLIHSSEELNPFNAIIEGICIALLNHQNRSQILFPYRMIKTLHWITGRIIIDNPSLKELRVDFYFYDSAAFSKNEKNILGEKIAEFFKNHSLIENFFFKTTSEICKKNKENLKTIFAAIKDKFNSNISGSLPIPIQLRKTDSIPKNNYCGGYTARLIVSLAVKPSQDLTQEAVWQCNGKEDADLRKEDAEIVTKYNPEQSHSFGIKDEEYKDTTEYRERQKKEEGIISTILLEMEQEMVTVDQAILQTLLNKICEANLEGSEDSVSIKKLIVELSQVSQKPSQDLFLNFFSKDTKTIDENSRLNSTISLLNLWQGFIKLLKKKCHVKPPVLISSEPSSEHIDDLSSSKSNKSSQIDDMMVVDLTEELISGIKSNHQFTKLKIKINDMKLISSFANALEDNRTLKVLDFQGNTFKNREFSCIAKAMEKNACIEELRFDQNTRVTGDFFLELIQCISRNQTLRILSFKNNNLAPKDVFLFLPPLETNTALQILDVEDNQIDDDECLERIQKILDRNKHSQAEKIKFSEEQEKAKELLKEMTVEDLKKFEPLFKKIDELLEKLNALMNQSRKEFIKKYFEELTKPCESYLEYQILQKKYNDTNDIINDLFSSSDLLKGALRTHLNELDVIVKEINYRFKINFLKNMVRKPRKLFEGVCVTRDTINKRFRELSLEFHPDKSNQWVREKDQEVVAEVSRLINEYRGELLLKFRNLCDLEFYEEAGKAREKTAVIYWHASKGHWDRLRDEEASVYRQYSPLQLNLLCIKFAESAYQNFRSACLIADDKKNIDKQICFRKKMARCFRMLGKAIEAQLCAASIYYLIKKSSLEKENLLTDARKFLEKIKKEDFLEDSTSLVPSDTKAITPAEPDIKIASKLIVSANQPLARYQIPTDLIELANSQGFWRNLVGYTVGGVGLVGEVGSLVTVGTTIANFAMTGSLGGPIGLVMGVAGWWIIAMGSLFGTLCGLSLVDEGNRILRETGIRESLNSILRRAVSAFNNGNYREFVTVLSKPYDRNKSLWTLNAADKNIDHNVIINELLTHGFAPYSIANLLILMAEALCSGEIEVEGVLPVDRISKAKTLLAGIYSSERLEKEAEKIDARTREQRMPAYSQEWFTSTFKRIYDTVFSQDTHVLAAAHNQDADETPCKSRLYEMFNVAKINCAILQITQLGREASERDTYIKNIKKTMSEVQKYISHNFRYTSIARFRLEVLQDLLWIMIGEKPEETFEIEFSITPRDAEIPEPALNDLYKQLQVAGEIQERLNIHRKLACRYEKLALDQEKEHHLTSIVSWKKAYEHYQKLLNHGNDQAEDVFGHARCLLKLNKYGEVIEFLKATKTLANHTEYWCLLAVAFRKKFHYKEARQYVMQAIALDATNQTAIKEKQILERLEAIPQTPESIRAIHQVVKQKRVESSNFYTYRHEKAPVYRILSIDGGGIRGIIPLLALCELEKETNRPLAHLFNMHTGISTGGIIAAATAAPAYQDATQKLRCSYRPRNSAADTLELYSTQAKDIFEPWLPAPVDKVVHFSYNPLNSISRKVFPKYTHAREPIFKKYFQDFKLSDMITDLVIPGILEKSLNTTHYFTRRKAKVDSSEDPKMVDVMMGITNAPTIFSEYEMPTHGKCLDAGIHENNPCLAAWLEAKDNGISPENIFVLSLGTGVHTPQLSNILPRGELWVAYNMKELTLSHHEGSTDLKMYKLLKKNYNRWQVFLENPIELDRHDEESIRVLYDIGTQQVEELHASGQMDDMVRYLTEDFSEELTTHDPKVSGPSVLSHADSELSRPSKPFGSSDKETRPLVFSFGSSSSGIQGDCVKKHSSSFKRG